MNVYFCGVYKPQRYGIRKKTVKPKTEHKIKVHITSILSFTYWKERSPE